jgi:YD repeat-containing protein
VSFSYDDGNRRTLLTLPNGIEVSYDYDAAWQLTGLTYTLDTTTLGTLSYTYDLAGNRTDIGGTWARTNLPAALASATYDAANQITAWGSTSFSYDANGSLTSDGAQTYTWNARNQLTGLSGGASASFQYDGLGRRRAKTIASASTGFLDELHLRCGRSDDRDRRFDRGDDYPDLRPARSADERDDAGGERQLYL